MIKNPPANAGDAGDVGPLLGWQDPLELKMATHSSILAGKIPWTEEPGWLGSQKCHISMTEPPSTQPTAEAYHLL